MLGQLKAFKEFRFQSEREEKTPLRPRRTSRVRDWYVVRVLSGRLLITLQLFVCAAHFAPRASCFDIYAPVTISGRRRRIILIKPNASVKISRASQVDRHDRRVCGLRNARNFSKIKKAPPRVADCKSYHVTKRNKNAHQRWKNFQLTTCKRTLAKNAIYDDVRLCMRRKCSPHLFRSEALSPSNSPCTL